MADRQFKILLTSLIDLKIEGLLLRTKQIRELYKWRRLYSKYVISRIWERHNYE